MTGAETILIGAAIGGGFTLAGCGLTSHGNAKTAQITNEAQATREREALRQQRIENAYIEIKAYLSDCLFYINQCVWHWADSEHDLPRRPQLEAQVRAAAALRSNRGIGADWDSFDSGFNRFYANVGLYRHFKKIANPADIVSMQETFAEMKEQAAELRALAEKLFEEMHGELSGS
jgi:hypothetical protein